MRIAKATLNSTWLVTTLLALAAYAVLATLDVRLRALSGVGTFDLQGFTLGAQYDAAFHAWGLNAYLSRAGFNLGFDYLFMPLCAAAMFYSGIVVMEAFAPAGSRLRRILSMAALAPLVAGALDAIENALHLTMLWGGSSDALAKAAHTVTTAKMVGFTIGLLLLLGAVLARVMERQKARLKQG
jgi:hypothetical protein